LIISLMRISKGMRREQLKELIDGTADPAFVLDPHGNIAAWNKSAEEYFGLNADSTVGKACSDILHGVDECGRACGANCSIKEKARNHEPVKSYEIEINTANGRRWCTMSVMSPGTSGTAAGYSVHVAHDSDLKKRFERMMREFVVQETGIDSKAAADLMASKSAPPPQAELSRREIDVLKMLAGGEKTAAIASKLFISPTTVNNHVQSIFKKLDAHTRLEAVRRAEKLRLI
jgi:PAS domain S-box-containing protein